MSFSYQLAQTIIEYIRNHPGCTRLQILQALEILESEFRYAKPYLKGKIKSGGQGKNFTYEVIK